MKKYLLFIGFFIVIFVAGIGFFNARVDPFSLYHFDLGDSDRLSRIDQFANMRFYKPRHVVFAKPEALVIGSSRSGAIIPDQQPWSKLASYNLSMPGITSYEMLRSVQHAHANHPLSKLMVGIDFEEFVRPRVAFRPGFEPARMAKRSSDLYSPTYLIQRLRDLQMSLFSLDALAQSRAALTQPNARLREYFGNGAWESVSKKRIGRSGYLYTGRNLQALADKGGLAAVNSLGDFEALLRFCYSNKIETKLFFTPTHVVVVDIWQRLGYGQLWQEFHRDVVALNVEVAANFGAVPFEIKAYGSLAGVVDEPIYLAKNAGKAWFGDGVHFGPKLGGKIMKSLWVPESATGMSLNFQNLPQYLQRVDKVRETFVQANQETLDTLYSKIDPNL